MYLTGEEEPAPPPGLEVPFGPGDNNIGPDAEASLEAALAAIQAAPPTARLLVEGHADSDGDEAYNGALSLRRAQAVASGSSRRAASTSPRGPSSLGARTRHSHPRTPPRVPRETGVVVVVEPSPA